MCKCAPALLTLRDQINARWPNRSKASDGCCASSAHHQQNPSSDHEPDASGYAHAFDVTSDPNHGVNGDVLVSLLMLDTRVKYLIWNRRIWFPLARVGGRKAGWSTYTGPNPHTKHVHCSIVATATHDTRPWPVGASAQPTPQPARRDAYMKVVIEAEHPDARWLIGPGVARHIGNVNELGQLEEAWGKAEKTLARSVIEGHAITGLHA